MHTYVCTDFYATLLFLLSWQIIDWKERTSFVTVYFELLDSEAEKSSLPIRESGLCSPVSNDVSFLLRSNYTL